MKAAELRDCDDPPGFGHLPRNWALLVQPQVGPGSVVVAEIRSQGSLQMPRVQDDEMVEAISADRADEPFGIRICPCRQLHRLGRFRRDVFA